MNTRQGEPTPPIELAGGAAGVTARLATGPANPRARVELLCDPHAPLRYLAAEHIAESGDMSAYLAALDWLEEPALKK